MENPLHLFTENTDWRTVEKPGGIPVFTPNKSPEGDCLLQRYLKVWPESAIHAWPKGFDSGIAHRLDIPTTGLVIAAKSPESLKIIRDNFSQKRLQKHYFFVSRKDVSWDRHEMTAEIGHDKRKKRRMVVKRGSNTPVRGKWLEAKTLFNRVGKSEIGHIWHAEMSTGVMHQIRLHAAFAGIALAGDTLYGGGLALRCAPHGSFLLHHFGIREYGWSRLPQWWPEGLRKITRMWINTHFAPKG